MKKLQWSSYYSSKCVRPLSCSGALVVLIVAPQQLVVHERHPEEIEIVAATLAQVASAAVLISFAT